MDEFLKKLKSGDNSAFEKLCSDYQQKIYSLAFGMCGNREDALDITQEVLIKIHRGIKSFKGDSSLSTWIYKITKNACYDFLRKNKVNVDEGLTENFVDISVPSADELIILKEKKELVRKFIKQIPVKYKMPLLLREYRGLRYNEIAEILEISEGTVKSRIFRAREYLLKLISENNLELF